MRDINLLPEEIRTQDMQTTTEKIKRDIAVKPIIIGVVVVIVMLLSILFPKIYIKILESKKDSIDKQLLDQRYVQVRTVNTQLANISSVLQLKKDVINTIDKQSYPVSEMLGIVKQLAPGGTTINDFSFNSSYLNFSVTLKNIVQYGELVTNAKRLEFLTPVLGPISWSKESSVNFQFEVGRKDGK